MRTGIEIAAGVMRNPDVAELFAANEAPAKGRTGAPRERGIAQRRIDGRPNTVVRLRYPRWIFERGRYSVRGPS
ncbi:hypothetical protein ACVBGC_17935 [Burkholderia stagnalis]